MSAPRIVLVTGTDTEVGKTVVGCGLARCLVGRGRRVVAVKPVESGCGPEPADSEDGVRLARAAGQEEPGTALTRLRAPLAPPVAADREGVRLDHHQWCRAIEELARHRDVVLVEAAGGLLSPSTWDADARDLAAALDAAALVVSPDRLGTLNHTLLTLEALGAGGVEVLGVVLNAPDSPDDSTGTNADALRRVAGPVRVAELPRLADPDRDAALHLEAVAGWLEER
ncbi:MAG: dethiobiotin synthase [Planctomycetota bacterium]|jgi:dethiobiotin synthase